MNSTFHWVQDQPKAVREFGRVLKSGGRLGISGGSGDFVAIHEKIKEDVLSREPYRQYPEHGGPTFIKQRDLEGLLDQAGFGERRIVVNTIVKTAKDGAEMVEWLDTSSSGATYGGIPLDLRPKAREEMLVEAETATAQLREAEQEAAEMEQTVVMVMEAQADLFQEYFLLLLVRLIKL